MNDTVDSSEGSPEWEDPNATLVLETGRPLEDELWFHGVLPRGEVVRLLVSPDMLFFLTTAGTCLYCEAPSEVRWQHPSQVKVSRFAVKDLF